MKTLPLVKKIETAHERISSPCLMEFFLSAQAQTLCFSESVCMPLQRVSWEDSQLEVTTSKVIPQNMKSGTGSWVHKWLSDNRYIPPLSLILNHVDHLSSCLLPFDCKMVVIPLCTIATFKDRIGSWAGWIQQPKGPFLNCLYSFFNLQNKIFPGSFLLSVSLEWDWVATPRHRQLGNTWLT